MSDVDQSIGHKVNYDKGFDQAEFLAKEKEARDARIDAANHAGVDTSTVNADVDERPAVTAKNDEIRAYALAKYNVEFEESATKRDMNEYLDEQEKLVTASPVVAAQDENVLVGARFAAEHDVEEGAWSAEDLRAELGLGADDDLPGDLGE